jgi:hypothetical protein
MHSGDARTTGCDVRPAYRLRQVVNALNLSTVAGLALAKASGATLTRGRDGIVLALGARGRFPDARAFTVGNVVVLRVEPDDDLLRHESHHSTQWAWCVVVFLPLYLLAVAWSYARTGDHWSRNWFERRAGLESGGYVENPTRRLRRHTPSTHCRD